MIRKNGEIKWEPVLIDYGPGAGSPIYWLCDTLCRCCLSVGQDNKLNELYNFLDAQRSSGNLEMNINSSNKLLEEIEKIRNN